MAWRGFHREHTPHASGALFDRNGAEPQAIQFIARKASCETEPLAVVIYYQDNLAVILPQFYHHMRGSRMFFYIVECFTVNLEYFAAHPIG